MAICMLYIQVLISHSSLSSIQVRIVLIRTEERHQKFRPWVLALRLFLYWINHGVRHLHVADDYMWIIKTWILNINSYFIEEILGHCRPLKWSCGHILAEKWWRFFWFVSFDPRLMPANPSETIWSTLTLKSNAPC